MNFDFKSSANPSSSRAATSNNLLGPARQRPMGIGSGVTGNDVYSDDVLKRRNPRDDGDGDDEDEKQPLGPGTPPAKRFRAM